MRLLLRRGQITAKLVRQIAAPYRPIKLMAFRVTRPASGHREPTKSVDALREAGECALESDIRTGTADLADMAFIAELRRWTIASRRGYRFKGT